MLEEKEAETEFLELQLGALQREREIALMQVQSLERDNRNLMHEVELLRGQIMETSPSRTASVDTELTSPEALSSDRQLKRELAAEQARNASLSEDLNILRRQMKAMEMSALSGREAELFWREHTDGNSADSPRSFVEWRMRREQRQASDVSDEPYIDNSYLRIIENEGLESKPLLKVLESNFKKSSTRPRKRTLKK